MSGRRPPREPNVGIGSNVLLVSMRDIAAGEELTIDYALFLGECWLRHGMTVRNPRPVEAWVTGTDGTRTDLGERYRGYLLVAPPEDRPNPGPSDPIALMDNAEPDILPALLRTTPAAVRHAESALYCRVCGTTSAEM